jgi:hypothetical protein
VTFWSGIADVPISKILVASLVGGVSGAKYFSQQQEVKEARSQARRERSRSTVLKKTTELALKPSIREEMDHPHNNLANKKGRIVWNQVVLNRAGHPLKDREVVVAENPTSTVADFGEFCVESGGDRYMSVGTAMNELNEESFKLLNEVYNSERDDDVASSGKLLETCVALHKALESYYLYEFGLRDGTVGD